MRRTLPHIPVTPDFAYTQVSSHIRSRHRSSGIDVPVYSGQK